MANTGPHRTPPTKADLEERGGPKPRAWLVPGSSSTRAEEDEGGPKGPTKGPSLSPPSVLHPRQSPLQESRSSHLALLAPGPLLAPSCSTSCSFLLRFLLLLAPLRLTPPENLPSRLFALLNPFALLPHLQKPAPSPTLSSKMDGRRSRSAQAPTDTHTAPEPEEVVPSTPLDPRGGPSPNAARVPAAGIATAGRALASTLAASLPADQMEVLLNLIIQKGDNTTTTAPASSLTPATGNPPLSSFPPAVTSLQIRFPTVDPIYFKEILENRFRPENLIKLSSTFMQPPRRQESITLGSFTIPTSERDGDASEYRGLASITQPLGIYIQALLHFCPDSVERELGHALHLYTDLLHTINRSHTLESLKTFHFAFHRKRMALRLYDPTGWRDRDSDLQ